MVVEVLAYTVKVLMELVALQISAPVKEATGVPEDWMEEMDHIITTFLLMVVNMVVDRVRWEAAETHMMDPMEQFVLFGPELLDNFLQLILQV